MRTKDEILSDMARNDRDTVEGRMVEVLLDIRDLLAEMRDNSQPAMEPDMPDMSMEELLEG